MNIIEIIFNLFGFIISTISEFILKDIYNWFKTLIEDKDLIPKNGHF
jgi:hypothetical protein